MIHVLLQGSTSTAKPKPNPHTSRQSEHFQGNPDRAKIRAERCRTLVPGSERGFPAAPAAPHLPRRGGRGPSAHLLPRTPRSPHRSETPAPAGSPFPGAAPFPAADPPGPAPRRPRAGRYLSGGACRARGRRGLSWPHPPTRGPSVPRRGSAPPLRPARGPHVRRQPGCGTRSRDCWLRLLLHLLTSATAHSAEAGTGWGPPLPDSQSAPGKV